MTVHRCGYRVIYGDTDGMGIVYYANYFRFIEMARTEFFRDHIRHPIDMVQNDMYTIVVKAYLEYHSPAGFDDELVITSWIPAAKIKQASFRFEYAVSEKRTGRKIVSGYTVHALTTREGKLRRMPRDFLKRLEEFAEKESPAGASAE